MLLPAAALADFALGMAAYQRGSYEDALREWRPLAQQGNASAQEMLGFMYLYGQGVERSDSNAVRWYRRAAENGLATAQNSLGVLYERGRGVLKNFSEAAKWYRYAVGQDHVEAKNNLGRAYMDGRGVSRNDAEALRLFREAAAEGLGRAMINLGRMYEQGQGVAASYDGAAEWYIKAVATGETARAHDKLVAAARRGSRTALAWLQRVADEGNAELQRELGLMYRDGIGIPQSFMLAHYWFNVSAALGNERALKELKIVERVIVYGDLQEARARAAAWWKEYNE